MGASSNEKNLRETHNPFSEHEIFIEEEEEIRADDFFRQESLHILHVDDDASFLQASKMILESENKFRIDTATSVDEAFCKLKTQTYDAVVSDYDMSLKNGLDFLKELREQKNNIVFIIFAGRGREEVAIRALNLGADQYINKNGSPEAVYCELANAIRNIVERKTLTPPLGGKHMLSSVGNRNFETLTLKRAYDKIIGAYLDGLILCRLKNKFLSGYDLLQIIYRDFNLHVSPGTMYATLYSLERQGFIECVPNGRKRVCRLTDKGKVTMQIISKSKKLRYVLYSIGRELFSGQG